jgi:hypothetical protein
VPSRIRGSHFVSPCFASVTSHFQAWLTANGYGEYNFARTDLGANGSYGGKANASDTVVNQPVIFIHGNSDAALGSGLGFTGWTSSINYFISHGYKTSELYATTRGDASPALSAYQYHSKPNLQKVRAFIQAVKAYTGAANDGNTIQTLLKTIELGEDYIDAQVKTIKTPTLIIWGKQDGLILLAEGERLKKDIAGSEMIVFDECGHVPQAEKAQEFNAAVLKFLAK